MKTRFVVYVVGCLVLLNGCDLKCDGYAPKGVEISWNEYNTVSQVNEYFQYKNTTKQHQNDTVRMCGYVLGMDDTNYFQLKYEELVQKNHLKVCLSDYPDIRLQNDGYIHGMGGLVFVDVSGNYDQMKWIKDYKPGQKIYVVGFCYIAALVDDRGCFCLPSLRLVRAVVKN